MGQIADVVLLVIAGFCLLWGSVYFLVHFSSVCRAWFDRAYYACQVKKFQLLGQDKQSSLFSNWGYVSDAYPCVGEKSQFSTYQECCKNLYQFWLFNNYN